jgi:hypothetical protein
MADFWSAPQREAWASGSALCAVGGKPIAEGRNIIEPQSLVNGAGTGYAQVPVGAAVSLPKDRSGRLFGRRAKDRGRQGELDSPGFSGHSASACSLLTGDRPATAHNAQGGAICAGVL